MNRILIIDDEQMVRSMLTKFFTNEGYEVQAAVNGREGLDQYRQKPFDIVITDIYMPEVEGLETIVLLKEEFPDAKIIAISGGTKNKKASGLGSLYQANLMGAFCTFTKPMDLDDLLAAVEDLVAL